ncbi:MAG: hypothetical protein HY273_14590 [Gammaproteobacteria bacterium]|nr:hypothetical protein [Gammaproteobacteria bacterium]
MTTLNTKQQVLIGLILVLLMLATRFHHFGSSLTLPDASLAIFFIAGFYLRSMLFFGALLAEAGLIDYVATANGVDGWCMSPAYMFLIPTYACLWLAGRWYARRHSHTWRTLVPLAAALLLSTGMAFLISNASFYLLSGYFPAMRWTEYATRVAQYFPPYLGSAFLYVAEAAMLHTLAVAITTKSVPGTSA